MKVTAADEEDQQAADDLESSNSEQRECSVDGESLMESYRSALFAYKRSFDTLKKQSNIMQKALEDAGQWTESIQRQIEDIRLEPQAESALTDDQVIQLADSLDSGSNCLEAVEGMYQNGSSSSNENHTSPNNCSTRNTHIKTDKAQRRSSYTVERDEESAGPADETTIRRHSMVSEREKGHESTADQDEESTAENEEENTMASSSGLNGALINNSQEEPSVDDTVNDSESNVNVVNRSANGKSTLQGNNDQNAVANSCGSPKDNLGDKNQENLQNHGSTSNSQEGQSARRSERDTSATPSTSSQHSQNIEKATQNGCETMSMSYGNENSNSYWSSRVNSSCKENNQGVIQTNNGDESSIPSNQRVTRSVSLRAEPTPRSTTPLSACALSQPYQEASFPVLQRERSISSNCSSSLADPSKDNTEEVAIIDTRKMNGKERKAHEKALLQRYGFTKITVEVQHFGGPLQNHSADRISKRARSEPAEEDRELSSAMKGAKLLLRQANSNRIVLSESEEDDVEECSSVASSSRKEDHRSSAKTRSGSTGDHCESTSTKKGKSSRGNSRSGALKAKLREDEIADRPQKDNKNTIIISGDEAEEDEAEDASEESDAANGAEGQEVDEDARRLLRKRIAVISSEEESGSSQSEPSDESDAPSRRTRAKDPKKSKNPRKRSVKPKKKRHRIAADSDEEEEMLSSNAASDDDNQEALSKTDSPSKRPVRFRQMISKKKLAQETVNAEAAERERCQRLREKQKEFNGIELCDTEDATGDIMLALTGAKPFMKAITLDPDKNGDPPKPVSVHPSLVKVLKPHQAEGGGILGHCMGLGKTLQVISFLQAILTHEKTSEHVKKVLIVAPVNVITNWRREFDKWLAPNGLDEFEIFGLEDTKSIYERHMTIKAWHEAEDPAILILGYEMFRMLTECDEDKAGKNKKQKPKIKKKVNRKAERLKVELRKFLQDPGPDLVICDEGHKLKNEDTTLSRVMNKIASKRRICLSGTPLQNNLDEYFTMVNFVKPGLLGTKKEFANRFANIIKRGQNKDAGIYEVRCMKRRCHVLYERLKNVLQRKDYRALMETIPPKQEYVILVSLTERQKELYKAFLERIGSDKFFRSRSLMPNYHMFLRIWSHPFLLFWHEQAAERKRILQEDDDFVVSGSESSPVSDSCDDIEDDDVCEELPSTSTKQMETKSRRKFDEQDIGRSETPEELKGWFSDLNVISKDDENCFSLSNKLVLIEQIMKKCEECGDKLLIFSHSLECLRYIQHMLHYLASNRLWFCDDHKALMAADEEWGWTMGLDYMVIDGSVSTSSREFIQDAFNAPDNLRARLLLISTKAGSLGTNLVGANRVVIFDASWNPSDDTQALFRVYRYGQSKPVYTYRLVAQGTMEQRIYNRQVTKESTAKRVTEEAQIQRHFDGHDLDELYKFDPKDIPQDGGDGQAPRLSLPKDRLLADIILSHGSAIESYMTHDTLFDEVDDEKLTDQDRAEAWEEYNREKDRTNVIVQNNRVQTNGPVNAFVNSNGNLTPADFMSNVFIDPIYQKCFDVPQMTNEIASQIVIIKRFLDYLMVGIPQEVRGGLNEFTSFFVQIIDQTKGSNASELVRQSIAAFRTTILTVNQVPSLSQRLNLIRSMAPMLFTDDNSTVL
ncbi:type III restriction enzyme, res subunit family protein [Ditylenchus destructor]|uniref:Type III restriction enzyme, res subunit family protein n=1 Tax=Ditylenchus destructor TaxID=166010 RepID=A0AAD4N6C0_9BILA|nr:type III restriction enzyme, res subunit family protein [Ditylenchus destructor]